MLRHLRYAVCLSICLATGSGVFIGQAAAAPDPVSPLRSAWIKALEEKNLNASIALYERDAIFLTPEGTRYVAQDAIRGLYQTVMAAYTSQIAMFSKRLQCSGDLCVDDGEYSESLVETASGKQLKLAGSYLLVAHRGQANAWKISEMAWTVTAMPSATPAAHTP